MKLPGYLALLLFLFSINARSQEISENTFGNGIFNVISSDSSYSMKFAARFQSLYTAQWEYPDFGNPGAGESNFLIRRARLKFDGFAYSPNLRYKLELGLTNRDISGGSVYTHDAPRLILDAVVKWNFYKNFELWAGQAKLPGNRERVISSANLETVDRSLLNSRFNIDREMGIQLRHFFSPGGGMIVREALAISQGEGRNVTTGNLGGYQYTGRIELLPFGNFADYSGVDFTREASPKMAVGMTYDHNANAVKTRSNSGRYMVTDAGYFETDISTFFIDAMFKYKGWSVMGEYADRSADTSVALHEDGTPTGDVVNVGTGVNLQAGYLFRNQYQVTGRYTSIESDQGIGLQGTENQYTLGLSKYFMGHKLKVQTDLSLNEYQDSQDNGLLYRLQFDLHF